jgi:glutamyl-tRNA synthetase
METIVTRFPPSPTGYLHVGGARTALFNWLYARQNNGKFVLRIEDTDTVRSTQASVDAIFEAMDWLELDWDEGPYFQTQRFELYREYLQKLLDSGDAYYCTCTQQEVEAMRQKAMAEGGKPKYDGRCRERGLPRSDNAVIRFKSPLAGTTVVEDVIKGNIVFQNTEQDDFVVCRSDGTPTYNFVVVVDDITMGINTVIRGDDHVMNTPKQILLYRALQSPAARVRPCAHGAWKGQDAAEQTPRGHVGNRLPGHGLPAGCLHQLPGPAGVVPRRPGVLHPPGTGGKVQPEEHRQIRRRVRHGQADRPECRPYPGHSGSAAGPRVLPFFRDKGYDAADDDYLAGVIGTLHTRSKTLVEMADGAHFYYREDVRPYDEKAAKKFLKPETARVLALLAEQLEGLDNLAEKTQEGAFKRVMDETGLGFGKIAQPVRVALTGTTVSPGIFEVIEVLGKARVLARLRAAVEFIESVGG